MNNYSQIGFQIPDILLPNENIDLPKWAVIACDQFTSQPEYWQQVQKIIGDSPSTLNMILPEVYLGTPEEPSLIPKTQNTMNGYLRENIFNSYEGFVLVERTSGGKTRFGLLLALDLEAYDYHKGSQSLIRATEETIIERLPPRIKIRQGAPLELPHILVLIDDPKKTVIESIVKLRSNLTKLYDFELMMGSGHLTGYLVNDRVVQDQIVQALETLASPDEFREKYGVPENKGVLLFAMGDGNHSLATAKAIWEKIKVDVGTDHPSRYALVEIENVHDEALTFEPIHRIVFSVQEDVLSALKNYFGNNIRYSSKKDASFVIEHVNNPFRDDHSFGLIGGSNSGIITIPEPTSNLPVGSLQTFLDSWLQNGKAKGIDYVHGEEIVRTLGTKPGNVGFYLPAMKKGDLFKTVILDGSLPRKTFSMGEAKDKRFYMECRKIS